MAIQESNGLIAKFMGVNDDYKVWKITFMSKELTLHVLNPPLYNEDLNELIPVIAKIHNVVKTGKAWNHFLINWYDKAPLDEIIDIEKTYNTVISFIQSYNEEMK